jgi:hypothetical protein
MAPHQRSLRLEPSLRCSWHQSEGTRHYGSRLFKQLCPLIAVDYSRFATREKFIDEVLAGRRHPIGHGALGPISADDFETARNEGLALMRQYKDEIENLVVTDGFVI